MKSKIKTLGAVLSIAMLFGILFSMPTTALAAGHADHCVCGGNVNIGDHTSHSPIHFENWSSTDSMPNYSGNFVLTTDVTITKTWIPAENTVLCLNGHTLKLNAESGAVIEISNRFYLDVNFTLCDCGDGKITGGKDCGITVERANFVMFGGEISGNAGRYGGVEVGGSDFKMYGGKISNNTGMLAGGVGALSSDAVFYAGEISENTADVGGGIIIKGNNVTLCDIKIINNKATYITDDYNGGGVRYEHGTLTVQGKPIIKGNTNKDGDADNLMLATLSANSLNVGTLSPDAYIGISAFDYELEFSAGGAGYIDYFLSDNDDYDVKASGNNLEFTEHIHSYGVWKPDSADAKKHIRVCEKYAEHTESAPHKYEWVIDQKATAEKEGVKHEECVCGVKRNEGTAIEKLEMLSPETGDRSIVLICVAVMLSSLVGAAFVAKKCFR